MLRIVKGFVIAFVISFLVVIPTVAAQAADAGPSGSPDTSTVIPVAAYAPTAGNLGKPFLTDEQKADTKAKIELDRQRSIYEWELRSTLIALLVVGVAAGYILRGSARKKL